MKNLNTKLIIFLLIISTSCAHKILKKPEVHSVKKIAIISIYSNSVIYKIGGDGGGIAALSSLISKEDKSSTKKEKSFGGKRLINYALKTFSKKLSEVDQWKVISPAKIINTKGYKDFIKFKKEQHGSFSKITATVDKISYAYPNGMLVYQIKGNNFNINELKNLCKKLNVDAVAVIEFDMAYKANFAIDTTGTAVASVATAIKAVNSDGKIVIGTLDIKKGAGSRSNSEDQTAMISGEILFNNKVERMYQQAIRAEADNLVSKIRKEFSEKE